MAVVLEHFRPWDTRRHQIYPPPKRGSGPKANGLVKRVQTHGPDCSLPLLAIISNHAGICLAIVGEGTPVIGYR